MFDRNRITLRFILPVFILLSTLLIDSVFTSSYATEGGSGAYANGAEDFFAGRLPPPGTYLFNYFNYHYADRLKDNRGRTIPVNFSYELTGNGLRLMHVTDKKLFNADFAMFLVIPVAHVHVTYKNKSQSKSGLADITINPFILGWHFEDWHIGTGIDVKVPSGAYSKYDIANLGRNYFTFEPSFAFTYMNKKGYEVSSKIMYDINTKNNATDYLSGQEFHFDYTIGKKIDNLQLGFGGYYYKQVTDDEVKGHRIRDYRGEVFAVGPQFRYYFKNIHATFKYQYETLVKNRSEGEKLWFKLVYRF
ncbi:MAG: transporter [Syntrophorhabdaceae bacterium]|nr:transporter [Syntrophorhabdaceae bacterium]